MCVCVNVWVVGDGKSRYSVCSEKEEKVTAVVCICVCVYVCWSAQGDRTRTLIS